MTLRPYQQQAVEKLRAIINRYGFAYLSGEVRTGKTLTALITLESCESVLIVTKKKAIRSIQADVTKSKVKSVVRVINYEQLKNYSHTRWDAIIIDEAHTIGAFPKPSIRTKLLKKMIDADTIVLLMSGTPTPESYAQLYHQFWVCGGLPEWQQYKNFYSWAKDGYVNITKQFIGFGSFINNYSKATDKVVAEASKYMYSITQKEAGFDGEVIEEIHHVEMPEQLRTAMKQLKKDKTINYGKIELDADTGAKLMSMTHQLSSGTVIDNNGKAHIISKHKLNYINKQFSKYKKAIFYVYVAEGEMLKSSITNWTDDPEHFAKSKNATFICQVHAGKEGTNLSSADVIIFFNIAYSAVAYWQARARSQTIDGGNKFVHWIFSNDSIEDKILRVVAGKKNYTLSHFKNKQLNISKR